LEAEEYITVCKLQFGWISQHECLSYPCYGEHSSYENIFKKKIKIKIKIKIKTGEYSKPFSDLRS
jgi:hypothetical protein